MGSTRIPAFAHNMIAVRAASAGGLTPGEITFTAVLSLIRAAITSDTCCPRCHKRPTRANAPASALGAAIAAPPRRPPADLRTHPPAARRTQTIGPAGYTLTIVPSNLQKTDASPGS